MRKFFFGLFTLLIGEALVMMYLYTQTVTMRHDTSVNEKQLKEFELANIELRNELYAAVDVNRVRDIAMREGLSPISNPAYLEVDSGMLAKQ